MIQIVTFGGVIASLIMYVFFIGTFLLIAYWILATITVIAAAPGVLLTSLLFDALSKELVSSQLWVSSVIFAAIFMLLFRYFSKERYLERYAIMVVILCASFAMYHTYIAKENCVVTALDTMYSWRSASKNSVDGSKGVVVANNVNLRSTPHTAAPVINSLYANEQVVIKKISEKWCLVQVPRTGQEGWVFADYVKTSIQ